MKLLLWFLLILPFHSQAQSSTSFPLNIGDKWLIYRWEDDTFEYRYAVDDTMPSNGKNYVVLWESGYPHSTFYFRYDNGKVYRYSPGVPNDEFILFDLTRTVGDTISKIPRITDTSYVTFTQKTTNTKFGMTRNQYSFKYDYSRRLADDETYYIVVEGIGLVNNGGFGWSDEVRGAVIGGIEYGTLTKVKANTNSSLNTFELLQNYPNPFNPNTRIEFYIPVKTYVRVNIYDVLGRHIQTLAEQELLSGKHSYNWIASNYVSGPYFCVLQTEYHTQTITLLLQK